MTTENQDQPEEAAPQGETPAQSAPRRRATRPRAPASPEGAQEPAQEAAPPTRRRRATAETASAEEPAQEAAPRTRRRRATAETESTEETPAAAAEPTPKTTRSRTRATAAADATPSGDAAPTDEEASGDDKAAATPRRRSRAATAPKAEPEAKAAPTRRRSRAAAAEPSEADAQPARSRSRRSSAAAPATQAAGDNGAKAAGGPRSLPRLQVRIRSEIAPVLMKEFSYTSSMQVPGLSKVVVNIGLGEALTNARAMEAATRDVTAITGQRPVTTRAKKSIAGFKIREGMPIGLSVTLRGRRMYEFLDRLISSALPRIRDFQGVPRESFDGRGNYSLGIREQVIFPEIDYNSIDRIRGLQVVICTTARTDHEGLRFLEQMGMPFARTREASQVA